jgi:hypothetical protein
MKKQPGDRAVTSEGNGTVVSVHSATELYPAPRHTNGKLVQPSKPKSKFGEGSEVYRIQIDGEKPHRPRNFHESQVIR